VIKQVLYIKIFVIYKMVCQTYCIIAGAFICASIFVCFLTDKKALHGSYLDELSRDNQVRYKFIVQERRKIYFQGFALGFILSVASLYLNNRKSKQNRLTNICQVLAISFTVNYFYYILYPKTDYMAKYLETEKQRVAWLRVYKTMQFNYHFGFVLGLVGMFFVARAIC
tara:strand:- start:4290 stop:4796 length:507 start_codon:yes stop_codon:yes gene_type:complete